MRKQPTNFSIRSLFVGLQAAVRPKILSLIITPMGKMLAGMFVIILSLAGFKAWQIMRAIAQHSSFAMPPEAVTSLAVQEMSWLPEIEVIGSLEAYQGVTLKSEESGKVAAITLESGASVKKGDILAQLDTSVEAAELKSAEAREELARVNYARAEKLFKSSAMPASSFDTAKSELKQAEGNASAIRATIERKTITAPFNGRAGIRMVNLGEYVSQGQAIVPLYMIDPLYLKLSVPQQQLDRISVGQTVKFAVDAYPGELFEGKINAINPQLDTATRNVEVQATVPNPTEKLRPGMFAKVSIIGAEAQKVLAVPVTSISYAPYGDSVYVIEKMRGPDGKEYDGVRQQIVKLGPKRGDFVSIVEGLRASDVVVTSGVFKLRPGAAVLVNNSVMPSAEIAPQPSDT